MARRIADIGGQLGEVIYTAKDKSGVEKLLLEEDWTMGTIKELEEKGYHAIGDSELGAGGEV